MNLRHIFLICFFNCFIHTGQNKFGIVIHGGAGNITEESMKDPAKKEEYLRTMKIALDSGYALLERGGKATEAVMKAITILEDSPLFNAGRGSVWNSEGEVEMDASIMDGRSMKAGSVCGVKKIRNPILAAHLVMEQTPHVLLCGNSVEQLWVKSGGTLTPNAWFIDTTTWLRWKQRLHKKHGTVGAVALDKSGNLAAGTSTGGMQDKMPGRVGDAPIIGAGTYADNNGCAISCTGHGEMFIRMHVASHINDLMLYANMKLSDAVKKIIHQELPKINGTGGVIGIDKNGNIAMDFNTPGMFRGYKHSSKGSEVLIFKQ
ncbi:MAG: isoaspartyl peptidase/L-asparaginase [Bacteroidia bacterium]|nr:isoaspartyl peptidase/L-asparaginase [Bacteroidia bacterium]